ncbi:MAG: AraC family transcriptional regulator [Clostridia bacterium]|nr:AraC family transcriptional regulator [Clostridia bacterium]
MLAKHEVWKYSGNEKVWVGKYKNSHNLLHWHYDCELICVEKGEIDVFCDKQKHTLIGGESLFIDSGQVHYMQARDPETMLIVIIFDYDLIRPFADNLTLANAHITKDYGIPQLYGKIKAELKEKKFFYDVVVATAMQKLMVEIFRSEKIVPKTISPTNAQSFKKLLAEITEKFEFYTFEEAASFMGMSPAYFSRLFHAMSGMTFSQYLNYVRINNAVRLINSDRKVPITEVAIRCGFSTIRNFNRTFKELTGYQPKRLPEGFSLDEKFIAHGDESFNPTLEVCELVESGK